MSAVSRLLPPGRLLWLDAARGAALFGMMSTHIFELHTADLEPTPAVVFAGRSSALFAVLAGFSLVLSSRSRMRESPGRAQLAAVVRGAVIFFIGLVLGSISTRLAIILTVYGVLFVAASAFLRLRGRTLAILAAVWLIASPFASHAIRAAGSMEPDRAVPGLSSLADPLGLIRAVVLTGYYPALQWMAYILVGMALAHVRWTRRTGFAVLIIGAGLTVMSMGVSTLLLVAGGWEATSASAADQPGLLEQMTIYGNWGTAPTDTLWWLAADGPHTGTPPDLVGTSATAAAVIAALFLVFDLLPTAAPRALSPLHAPGSMALSAYSLHTIMLEITAGESAGAEYAVHAAMLIAVAFLWKALVSRRGPLEAMTAAAVRVAVR